MAMKAKISIIIIFAFLAISTASGAVIDVDRAHHHLGDEVKSDLTPANPEGTIYTKTFHLDKIEGDTASLNLITKSVVPTDTLGAAMFYDYVYVNGNSVGKLNDYIEAKEQDSLPRTVKIYFSTSMLKVGENNITIASGSNADGTDYDDFEFYDLKVEIAPESEYPYIKSLSPPLKNIWSYSIGGYRYFPELAVSESGDIVFVPSIEINRDLPEPIAARHKINALDTRNGGLIWSYETGAGNIYTPLAYEDGVVFASDGENIYAIKAGALKWKFNLSEYRDEYNFAPPVLPVVHNKTTYTTINNAGLIFAIDADSGKMKWKYKYEPVEKPSREKYVISYRSTLPAANGDIVVLFAGVEYTEKQIPKPIEPGTTPPEIEPEILTYRKVVALNASSGEEIWSYPCNGRPGSEIEFPIISNELVYLGLENEVIALSLRTGRAIWSTDLYWPVLYAVADGRVFASVTGDTVALDAFNGSLLWRSQGAFGTLAVYDGMVYAGISGDENLLVINASTGMPLWKGGKLLGYAVSKPVVSHGRLYLTCSDGKLYAFEHGEASEVFMQDLWNSSIAALPLVTFLAMLIPLAILLKKMKNKSLVFGAWLIALVGMLYLSVEVLLRIIPESWGMALVASVSLPIVLLIGILFLAYGAWRRRKKT